MHGHGNLKDVNPGSITIIGYCYFNYFYLSFFIVNYKITLFNNIVVFARIKLEQMQESSTPPDMARDPGNVRGVDQHLPWQVAGNRGAEGCTVSPEM